MRRSDVIIPVTIRRNHDDLALESKLIEKKIPAIEINDDGSVAEAHSSINK
jgi:hypothetical protein